MAGPFLKFLSLAASQASGLSVNLPSASPELFPVRLQEIPLDNRHSPRLLQPCCPMRAFKFKDVGRFRRRSVSDQPLLV
jgi:hypothetical protein